MAATNPSIDPTLCAYCGEGPAGSHLQRETIDRCLPL
uniref:Uncharacterized protein n=1 Tax=Arundo donax TaxID=35708 RepID=A0A0A9HB10_ARUDO